jgi:hypothetical protein
MSTLAADGQVRPWANHAAVAIGNSCCIGWMAGSAQKQHRELVTQGGQMRQKTDIKKLKL